MKVILDVVLEGEYFGTILEGRPSGMCATNLGLH